MATKFNAEQYSISATNTDLYSDFYSNLDIHPGTGDIARVKNDQAVIQSVRNLLLTDHYERPFAPLIGSTIRQMLFEDVSPYTAVSIRIAIEDTLNNYEPRVSLIETIVEPDADENGYNIRLKFSLINRVTPVEMGFFLNRTR